MDGVLGGQTLTGGASGADAMMEKLEARQRTVARGMEAVLRG
jgi:hypothetical protein